MWGDNINNNTHTVFVQFTCHLSGEGKQSKAITQAPKKFPQGCQMNGTPSRRDWIHQDKEVAQTMVAYKRERNSEMKDSEPIQTREPAEPSQTTDIVCAAGWNNNI